MLLFCANVTIYYLRPRLRLIKFKHEAQPNSYMPLYVENGIIVIVFVLSVIKRESILFKIIVFSFYPKKQEKKCMSTSVASKSQERL